MIQLNASIVLYHNNKNLILKAISSFLNTDLAVKLYLIDNSSNDNLRELQNIDERIEYIFTGANLGYGKAHNIAMQKSIDAGEQYLLAMNPGKLQKRHMFTSNASFGNSKYHLLLNPDIYFDIGTIEKLYEFMERNPDVGMVMPKILYPDGSLQYLCKLLPSPFELIFRRFLPFKNFNEKRNYIYELRFSEHEKIMEVPSLSGCFMFIRTEVLKKVGLFDERYFMYLEDIDLSRRIHKKNRIIYYPDTVVYHEYEKGSYKNIICLRYHLESAVKYFNKWGWFFDRERKELNRRTLERLGYF